MSRRTVVTILLMTSAGFLLMGHSLGRAPFYLTQDEVFFGLSAHSIATTGRDINGVRMPLYFQWPGHLTVGIWFQPMLIYFTALFLKVLPISVAALRLPGVVVGVINAVLIYLIGRRMFRNEWLGVMCGVLLLLTP